MATGWLEGLRVIEFVGQGPVPFAAMVLHDLGADVLRVARAGTGDGYQRGAPHRLMGRGVRCVELDLKTSEGVDTALQLADRADVLLEGFRPGVMERLGLGPQVLRSRNRRLVYGRVSGWGRHGPWADRPGHDINYVGLTGVLAGIGPREGNPSVPLNLVGDYAGGSMMLLAQLLAALVHRATTGEGAVVDVSMLEGITYLATPLQAMAARGEWRMHRESNWLDGGAPFYGVYRTADDRHLAVGAIERRFYAELLEGLGLPARYLDEQWERSRWHAVRQEVAAVFRSKLSQAWLDQFAGTQACVTPVLDFDEARLHAQAEALGLFTAVGGLTLPRPLQRPATAATGETVAPSAALASWLVRASPRPPGGAAH